ncbi:hypothetical protein VKT23_008064 [Stygiomarasmius scandens]|uniref:Heterokaryon incompatibility domain-containing protein n=1 Tax=Marasmiellus scandens TaxID=2682957 RepID=A0ABR1JLX9_9AGAR
MRLLNTKTFRLEEFYVDIPPYAILSHTWEEEEITFKDIQIPEVAKYKAGWRKIDSACAHARKYDFKWIWIDSCCINKESSAELSEAINSMYQYYEDSEVCYVNLCDFVSEKDGESAFSQCKWFKRGWTLQELLAPCYVVFLDKNWSEVGTKWSLRSVISVITTIPVQVLTHRNIQEYSIAQRMSWAASRETTRPEDQAYCLMGIFNVSMSPIYGEGGTKAFMRLQQEIIKYSDDRSIFAWTASPGHREARGLLAMSPYEFWASGKVGISDSDLIGNKSSYSFGNNGLLIHLPLTQVGPGLFLASLHCRSFKDDKYLSVYLQKMKEGQYVRWHADELPANSSSSFDDIQEVIVKENSLFIHRPTKNRLEKSRIFPVRLLPSAQNRPFTFLACNGATFDKETGRVAARFNNISLKYDIHGGKEECSILTGFRQSSPCFDVETNMAHPGSEVRMQQGHHRFPSSRTEKWADRFSKPLQSGGMVSVAIQMTGNQSVSRILEIDWIAKNVPSPMTRQVQLSVALVCTEHPQLSFQNVFPPDPFRKHRGEQIYISIPDVGYPFRILAFNISGISSHVVYVAFGLHESRAWTDIVLPNQNDGPSAYIAAKIWRSYLDSGSNVERRLNGRASVSVVRNLGYLGSFGGVVHREMTATVEERVKTTLQPESHVLQFSLHHRIEPGSPSSTQAMELPSPTRQSTLQRKHSLPNIPGYSLVPMNTSNVIQSW